MIILRSADEINQIRQAGRIVVQVLNRLKDSARAGTKTETLDRLAEDEIIRSDGSPAFKNYKGFPASICASINDVIVHGIPSSRCLVDGDIISIDVGVKLGNYYADGAATFAIGRISPEAERLIKITEEALAIGIETARRGKRVSDISSLIQRHVEAGGFSIVRAFVGHGIGTKIHEEPEIPNYGKPGKGPRLEPGMVLAIEPMVNAGTHELEILEDGWTAVTKDRKLSAHFEHTIAITENGPEILTKE